MEGEMLPAIYGNVYDNLFTTMIAHVASKQG